jgi:hypothetical protein
MELPIQQSTSNDLKSRPINAGCVRCAIQVPHTILKIDTGLHDETCTLADDALDAFFFLSMTAMFDLDPDLCVDRFIFQCSARKEVGMENFHKQLSAINDRIFISCITLNCHITQPKPSAIRLGSQEELSTLARWHGPLDLITQRGCLGFLARCTIDSTRRTCPMRWDSCSCVDFAKQASIVLRPLSLVQMAKCD